MRIILSVLTLYKTFTTESSSRVVVVVVHLPVFRQKVIRIMIWILAVAIIAIALWYYLAKPLSYWSDMGVRQTKPWIFIGDMWMILFRRKGISDFTQWLYNLYPNERYVGWYNISRPVLLLRDPELIKQVGVKDFDSFVDHAPFLDPDADPLWSKSLLALNGERWKEIRNAVTPTFTSSKIKNMFALIVESAENFVDYFNRNSKGDQLIELDMKDAYTRFTNDVIATTAFGIKVDSLKDQQNTFYEMGKRITNISGFIKSLKLFVNQAFPKLFKYFGVPFLDSVASKYLYKVIDETIKVREEKNIVRPDMIHLLLEARKSQLNKDSEQENSEGKLKRSMEISNAEITSQAAIFFFGGFDTVSTALCFGSYELALNKDIQNKLREEIVETAKKGKITYDTLQHMSYMDMVVSEILRKWPPFPTIDRICTTTHTLIPEDKTHKELSIKQGIEISFPIYAIQRDPKYFPNPEKFDPDRFSEENKNNIVPYTYIPFGVGPRNCIGNRFALIEIKTLLYHLLLNYEIVTTKKTAIPLVLKKDFQVVFNGGVHLGLRRIQT